MSDSQNEKPEENPVDQHLTEEKQAAAATSAAAPGATPLKWSGGRYSPKAFRFRRILLFLLTLACVAGGFYLTRSASGKCPACVVWSFCLGIPAILWIWLEAVVFYRSYTIRYNLEQDKLVTESGLLNHVQHSTLIAQINDIKFSQTLWDKLVNGGIGTVTLYTSDITDPELKLLALEKPQDAFETLEYVRKRGIKSFGTTIIDDAGGGGDDGGILG